MFFKKLEKLNVAICFYVRTLVINPKSETSKHLLNSIRGKTTAKAPASYIQDLFNQYAKSFDNDLITNLNYQAPSLLREFYEENFQNNKIKLNTLDLGCGTGDSSTLLLEKFPNAKLSCVEPDAVCYYWFMTHSSSSDVACLND